MKESKRIVAIIPVKEKSERTPNKNFRSFNLLIDKGKK